MEEFKDYFQTNCFLFIFEAFAKENSLDEIFWVCLISSKAFWVSRKKTHHHEIRFVTIFFNALGSLRNKENKGTVRQRSQSPLISSVAPPFSPAAAERFFQTFRGDMHSKKTTPPKTNKCPLKKDCLNMKCIFQPMIFGGHSFVFRWVTVPFNKNVSSHQFFALHILTWEWKKTRWNWPHTKTTSSAKDGGFVYKWIIGGNPAWTGPWFQIFLFSPLFGKISNLTNIFQMGWNLQLVKS